VASDAQCFYNNVRDGDIDNEKKFHDASLGPFVYDGYPVKTLQDFLDVVNKTPCAVPFHHCPESGVCGACVPVRKMIALRAEIFSKNETRSVGAEFKDVVDALLKERRAALKAQLKQFDAILSAEEKAAADAEKQARDLKAAEKKAQAVKIKAAAKAEAEADLTDDDLKRMAKMANGSKLCCSAHGLVHAESQFDPVFFSCKQCVKEGVITAWVCFHSGSFANAERCQTCVKRILSFAVKTSPVDTKRADIESAYSEHLGDVSKREMIALEKLITAKHKELIAFDEKACRAPLKLRDAESDLQAALPAAEAALKKADAEHATLEADTLREVQSFDDAIAKLKAEKDAVIRKADAANAKLESKVNRLVETQLSLKAAVAAAQKACVEFGPLVRKQMVADQRYVEFKLKDAKDKAAQVEKMPPSTEVVRRPLSSVATGSKRKSETTLSPADTGAVESPKKKSKPSSPVSPASAPADSSSAMAV